MESGISFICILAPTRFFVKSIKINIACAGCNSSAHKFTQPAHEFCQGKTRFYFFLTGSGKPACSRHKKNAPRGAHFFIFSRNLISSARAKEHSANSGLPRAENIFARKLLQPAFEFLTGKNSLLSLPHRLRQTRLLHKKKRPFGRFFFILSRNLISSEAMKEHSVNSGSPEPALLFLPVKEPGLL